MHAIYLHQNKHNLKIYVGYSKCVEKRWYEQRLTAYNVNDEEYNQPLYRAIRRDGWDQFTHQILETYNTKQEALEAEKFWIEYFRANRTVFGSDYGYNLHEGGNCPPSQKGHKDTTETRKRKSEAGKRKIFTKQHRANLSKASKGKRLIIVDGMRRYVERS